MSKEKIDHHCFRQWNIFWTIIAITLTIITLSFFPKLCMGAGDWSIEIQESSIGGINKLILIDNCNCGMLYHDLIFGFFFSIIITTFLLIIIWSIRWWILNSDKK